MTKKKVWRDQDGNEIKPPLGDVEAAMCSGLRLLGADGQPLPPESAPMYLDFQIDENKTIRILNAGIAKTQSDLDR